MSEATAEAKPRSKFRKWLPKTILMIGGLVVVYLLFTQVFSKFGDFEAGFKAAMTIPVGWFIAIIVTSLLSMAVYPLTANAAVPGLKYKPAFIDRQAGLLISSGVPWAGGPLAVGMQYKILDTYGVERKRAAAAVAADAVWTYMMTFGLPALSLLLLFVIEKKSIGTAYEIIAIVAAGIFLVTVGVIAIALRSAKGAAKIGALAEVPARWAFGIVKKTPPDIQTSVIGFHATASDMIAKRWWPITWTNVLAQLSPMLVIFAALFGMGGFPGDLSVLEVFVAYSVALLLASVPLAPGGLGTVDLALIGLLVLFGASSGQATAVDIIWRAFLYFPQMIVGLVALMWFFWDRRKGRPKVAPVGA